MILIVEAGVKSSLRRTVLTIIREANSLALSLVLLIEDLKMKSLVGVSGWQHIEVKVARYLLKMTQLRLDDSSQFE